MYLLWNFNSFQIPFQILDALKLGRFQNAYFMQSFKLVRQFWHFLKVLLWRFFWREIHQMSWNRWTLIMETSAPGWMSKRHSNHNFINVFLQNKINTCIKNTFKWVVCMATDSDWNRFPSNQLIPLDMTFEWTSWWSKSAGKLMIDVIMNMNSPTPFTSQSLGVVRIRWHFLQSLKFVITQICV